MRRLRRPRGSIWLARTGVRRGARAGAALSVFLLLLSGLSINALTAGIDIAPTAIGPPEHPFGDDGQDLPGGQRRRGPIPRAAFERFTAIPARGPAAFGGDRIYDIDVDGTSYRIHEFTTVGTSTFTVARPLAVEYLVVGGGGGGGAWVGGGGGGGGALAGTTTLNGAVTVAVGGGGLGAFYLHNSTASQRQATSGAPSSLGPSITAAGGGHGGTWNWQAPGSAGTGGGAGHTAVSSVSPAGQGFAGGSARGAANNGYPTGGGGGAGGPGQDWSATRSGDGGVGLASSLTGVEVRYGGGGGGGIHGHDGSVDAAPGSGRDGGGDGAARNTTLLPTQNGRNGLGGGGGGGGNNSNIQSFGGNGGSGIVIVRYEIPRTVWGPVATGGTVSEFVGDGTGGTVAGVRYRVHTFAADSTFVVPEDSTIAEVDVLLVGGGGGGGTRHGGGGGGGGVREVLAHPLEGTGAFPVVVGNGGSGAVAATATAPSAGSASTALGLAASGGGRGHGVSGAATSGGSGGGASSSINGAAGTAGQGNAGGRGVSGSISAWGDWAGGGGGGAGGVGLNSTGGGSSANARGGDGGPGRLSRLTGQDAVYGGGGGGSHELSIGNLAPSQLGFAGSGGSGGGAGGGLSWNLYHVASTQGHPNDEAQYDALIAAASHIQTGLTALKAADSTQSNEIDILNWQSATEFNTATGRFPRPDSNNTFNNNHFALVVTGTFVPRETGTYTFTIAGDDAVELFIGTTNVTNHYGGHGIAALGTHTGSIDLVAGTTYPFRVRQHERDGGEGLRLFWRKPSQAGDTAWYRDPLELPATGHDGVPNTGGGGGAGGSRGGNGDRSENADGGSGGSGIVAIRYPLFREVGAIPSGVRDAVAGEARSSAVVRWQVPALSPPSVGLGGYRIEFAPVNGSTWTTVTSGVTFTTTGSGVQTFVRADLTGIPTGPRHRFRITPLGDVDGPSTVVTPVAKGGDTVTLVGDEVVHRYTTAGSATFDLAESRNVRALLVGGGGGGAGGGWSGGGGAGGVLEGQDVALAAGSIPVLVGAGGGGGPASGAAASRSGGDGGASSLGVVSAPGGGGGGAAGWNAADHTGQGRSGGSGGGTGEHGSTTASVGVLLYETSNPRRSSGNIVYRSGFGTGSSDAWRTFTDAGTPITSVTYRMQVTVDGTSRFAEVTFDPWPGLTAQALRVPDLNTSNRFEVQRFVQNMRVESNMTAGVTSSSTGVVTGTGRTGYLELWPWNYSAGATASGPAGSNNSLYDFNDSHTGNNAYGSFQVHDVTTSGAERTILAWNDHNNSTPDVGLGNRTTSNPDWTFARSSGLGTSGWRLDIRVNKNPWQSLPGGVSTVVAPAGWTAHGHAGGSNGVMASQAGSGGGGAGGVGGAVPESSRLALNGVARPRVAGNGGPGMTSSITGSPVVYAGGGGGGTRDDGGDTCSVGGSGGGGAGRCLRTGGTAAVAGVAGLGGGGGGGHDSAGAPGGSGTVIVRYPVVAARGGDSVSEIVDGGVRYRVHRFDTPGPHTLEVLRDVDVEYLVVGGGASGTRGWCSIFWGHGGGGGGVSTGATTVGAGLVPVTVGAGGAGSTTVTCDDVHTGRSGEPSAFGQAQAAVTSTGGSGASSRTVTGGASGAGTIDGVAYGPRAGGNGTGGGTLGAGGGGGAGAAAAGVNGGAGVLSSITGTMISYGAGGPGRSSSGFGTPVPAGTTGIGGGGHDGFGGTLAFTPGGDGVVIVRYRIP